MKFPKFVIFELFQLAIPQKTHFSHGIQFQTKKVWSIWKKYEKINFFQIFFKIDTDQLSSIAIFSNLLYGISKVSCSMFWKGFEDKSYNRRAHYLKLCRNYRLIPAGGSPLPPLIRVKGQDWPWKSKILTVWKNDYSNLFR